MLRTFHNFLLLLVSVNWENTIYTNQNSYWTFHKIFTYFRDYSSIFTHLNNNRLLLGLPQWLRGENPPAMQEMRLGSLGSEDPLKEEMATHCSILARIIPMTEEPGGLQSMESQRVGYELVTEHMALRLWILVQQSWTEYSFLFKMWEMIFYLILISLKLIISFLFLLTR